MIAACGQMEALTIDRAAEAWPVVERLAARAAQAGADMLVLPETTYPAYWLHSVERYFQPDILRSAEVLKRFAALAAQHAFNLVAGFVEEHDGKIFNSAAMFDRKGHLIGISRKSFLWDCDNRWFSPGERIASFDTEFGRIGVLICADCRAPEIAASLVTDGARMLVLPTAWVNASTVRRTYRNVHPEFLIRARAMEFGVPFVCCSKAGREGEQLEYVGQSRIVDGTGRLLADAPIGGEHLIVAEVEPSDPKPIAADARQIERLRSSAEPFRTRQPGVRVCVNMKQSAASVLAALEQAGARVQRLEGSDIRSFVPSRVASLNGAQVLWFAGRIHDDALARARAAENRVFVIAATDNVHALIQLDGAVAYRDAELQADIEIDLAQADLKQFTPETDLWAQRRPASYRLTKSSGCPEQPVTCPMA